MTNSYANFKDARHLALTIAAIIGVERVGRIRYRGSSGERKGVRKNRQKDMDTSLLEMKQDRQAEGTLL
jgi:hypothetical protein